MKKFTVVFCLIIVCVIGLQAQNPRKVVVTEGNIKHQHRTRQTISQSVTGGLEIGEVKPISDGILKIYPNPSDGQTYIVFARNISLCY